MAERSVPAAPSSRASHTASASATSRGTAPTAPARVVLLPVIAPWKSPCASGETGAPHRGRTGQSGGTGHSRWVPAGARDVAPHPLERGDLVE